MAQKIKFFSIFTTISLVLVVFLVIFAKLWQLGQIPFGLNIDEASYGYDAYAISQTGKDQWSQALPLTLKSFGDYKPAGLSYFMIPLIRLFGLNTLTTRLPAAFFGQIILVLTYFILQQIKKSPRQNLILTLLLALSPWHYGMTRLFYEPTLALGFFLGGWLAFASALKNPNSHRNYVLGMLLMGVSGYFYVAYRLLSLLLIVFVFCLLLLHPNKPHLQAYFKSFVIYLLLILPLFSSMFGISATRLKQESALRTIDHAMSIDENRQMCYLSSKHNPLITKFCYVLWNKPVLKLERLGNTLITVLGVDYLFQNSYQPDIIPKGYGAYPQVFAIFYLLGLVTLIHQLFSDRSARPTNLYVVGTYLLVQLPGVIIEAPLVHRNLAGIFFAFVVIVYGWYYFVSMLSRLTSQTLLRLAELVVLIVVTFESLSYLGYYWTVYTHTNPELWRYDQKQIFNYVANNSSKYSQIIFNGFEDPLLYYAFYKAEDPSLWQQFAIMTTPNSAGWMHYSIYTKFSATNTNLSEYLCHYDGTSAVLFVTTPIKEFSQYAQYFTKDFTGVHRLHEIYALPQLIEDLAKNHTLLTHCKT